MKTKPDWTATLNHLHAVIKWDVAKKYYRPNADNHSVLLLFKEVHCIIYFFDKFWNVLLRTYWFYVSKLLFVWGLSSHSRIFHSYGDVIITCEGLQILTYARHSWPLSSESSLACHTYCDTGHLFTMDISEDPWHSHLLPSVLAVELSILF